MCTYSPEVYDTPMAIRMAIKGHGTAAGDAKAKGGLRLMCAFFVGYIGYGWCVGLRMAYGSTRRTSEVRANRHSPLRKAHT